jgi:hypothetical protein
MKIRTIYATTDNRRILKKVYKLLLTKQEKICNFCPYHGGENADRKKRISGTGSNSAKHSGRAEFKIFRRAQSNR